MAKKFQENKEEDREIYDEDFEEEDDMDEYEEEGYE